MNLRWIQPLLLWACGFCLADRAGANDRPSSLTVFGDSLSDVGNLSEATGGAFPGSDYFDGRLSNGLLYAEQLGFDLQPSLVGGSCYAVANARTGDSLIGLPTQLGWFAEANPGGADPDGLFLVWFGGNDVIDGYEGGDPAAAAAAITAALEVLRAGLEDLLAMGAQRIVVLNLPDLSRTPAVLEIGDEATTSLAQALTLQWNAGLAQIVGELAEPGVELFDVFAWFVEVMADPAAAGFSDVQSQALLVGGDADQFLFWDGVHPTAAAHRELAGRVLALLPDLALGDPVAIRSIERDPSTGVVSLVFDSRPGWCYAIEVSSDLSGGWRLLRRGFASQGDTSTFSELSQVTRRFYRVSEVVAPPTG